MASNNGKQSRESKAPEAVESTAQEAAAAAVEAVESVKAPEVIPSTAVVVAAAATKSPSGEASGVTASFDAAFDSSKWQKKSLDIVNENTTALFDFAERLSRAKSFEEVADLQTKFFSDRLDSLLRQSNELFELAQEMVNVTIAPLRGAKAA